MLGSGCWGGRKRGRWVAVRLGIGQPWYNEWAPGDVWREHQPPADVWVAVVAASVMSGSGLSATAVFASKCGWWGALALVSWYFVPW